LLPTGEDPDSLVRSQGATAFRQLLADATPLSDLLWQITMQDKNLDTPERRAGFAKDIREVVERIGDVQVKAFYERHYRVRLDEMFNEGRRGSGTRSSRSSRPYGTSQRTRRLSRHHGLGLGGGGITERRERVLVATIIGHPDLLDQYSEEFAGIDLTNLTLDRLRNEILEIARGSLGLDSAALKQHLCEKGYTATLDDIADARIAPLAPFVRPDVPKETAREGWENTLSVHRLAVTLPAEKSACIEEFDFTDEGFNRLKAFLGEAERSNTAETAAAGPTPTRTH
jgi:DNA primase